MFVEDGAHFSFEPGVDDGMGEVAADGGAHLSVGEL